MPLGDAGLQLSDQRPEKPADSGGGPSQTGHAFPGPSGSSGRAFTEPRPANGTAVTAGGTLGPGWTGRPSVVPRPALCPRASGGRASFHLECLGSGFSSHSWGAARLSAGLLLPPAEQFLGEQFLCPLTQPLPAPGEGGGHLIGPYSQVGWSQSIKRPGERPCPPLYQPHTALLQAGAQGRAGRREVTVGPLDGHVKPGCPMSSGEIAPMSCLRVPDVVFFLCFKLRTLLVVTGNTYT